MGGGVVGFWVMLLIGLSAGGWFWLLLHRVVWVWLWFAAMVGLVLLGGGDGLAWVVSGVGLLIGTRCLVIRLLFSLLGFRATFMWGWGWVLGFVVGVVVRWLWVVVVAVVVLGPKSNCPVRFWFNLQVFFWCLLVISWISLCTLVPFFMC